MSFLLFPGGGGTPTSDSGVFPVFLMTEDIATNLCLGEKPGLKFCTLGRSTCSVRKHFNKKVSVLKDWIYIAGPRNSAFSEILLDVRAVPPEQLEKLLSEKHTLVDWQRLFGAINSSAQGDLGANLAPDVFELVKEKAIQQPVTFSVTPRKQPLHYSTDKGLVVESEAQNLITRISPIGSKVYDMDLDTLLTAQLDKVLMFSQDIASDVTNFKKAVGEDIDRIEVAVQDLNLKAGKDPGLGDTPLLTAWEGIAFVNSVAQDAIQSASNVHNEMANVKHSVSALEQKMDAGARIPSMIIGLEEQLNQVTTLANLLVQENTKLWSELRSAPALSSTAHPTQEVDDLKAIIRQLEARLTATEARVSTSMNPMGLGSPASHVNFAELTGRFKTLEARVTSKPVMVAGRVFLSELDVEMWISQKAPTGVFYLFHDVVSLLECLNVTDVTRVDVLTEMHQAAKVSINSEAEA